MKFNIKNRVTFTALFFCSVFVESIAQTRPVVQQVKFKTDTVFIEQFGAKPNGQFLNTKPINDAITSTSSKGGGVVVVPAGLWLTGPIEMKSNVNLHITREAVLLFTDDFNEYKLVESNWEGQPAWRNQNPISGKNLENIAITGSGIIDGNGGAWRMVKKGKMTESQWKTLVSSGGVVDEKAKIWYPTESAFKGAIMESEGKIYPGMPVKDVQPVKDYLRPNLLVFTSCKRILIEGVTIQNSPAWNVHPLMSEDLTVRKVTIRNPWYAQNGDGIDVESCKNVLIEESTFDVGDDALCIKSGRDKAGRDRGMPTENVMIRNNIVFHGHGGFVIGSEMSGGARNIWVEDCSFMGTDIGLRFKTTRGRGGVVENIYIKNVNMVNIPKEAILFDMYYATRDIESAAGRTIPVTEETPQFKNFYIENVNVKGASKGIFFRGLPEMHIKNIDIKNSAIEAETGIEIIEASNINIQNVSVKVKNTSPLIQIENSANISFDKLTLLNEVDQLIDVKGINSKNIQIKNADLNKVKLLRKIDTDLNPNVLKIN